MNRILIILFLFLYFIAGFNIGIAFNRWTSPICETQQIKQSLIQ